MKLINLLKAIDYLRPDASAGKIEVRGISVNSKEIKKDFAFIAIRGARDDGRQFIPEAVNNGARVVIFQGQAPSPKLYAGTLFVKVRDARLAAAKLAAEYYGNPSSRIRVIGVTGTNGKTTVTYLLESILRENGLNPAVIGTVNYRLKKRVLSSKNTTPGPIELQSMLRDMAQEGADYAVMEVSSHALDQQRTQAVIFQGAAFTNLTRDHLDYHKTLDKYFQAKCRLFKALGPDSYAVINNDDPYGRRIARATRARVLTYGIDGAADVRAHDIKFGIDHTEFMLVGAGEKIKIKSRLIGKHNVYNMLTAASLSVSEGIHPEVIRRSLSKFYFVPGRLEKINSKGNFSVFVDYAHTPDALVNILNTLRQVSKKKLMVVFGCGGDRDKGKRPKMGACVTELADYAIITNDNPRSEPAAAIIRDIKRGIRKKNYGVIPDRFNAIKAIIAKARPGDTVLIAGKGHEAYQILKDRVIDFDDRKAAQRCLRSMN